MVERVPHKTSLNPIVVLCWVVSALILPWHPEMVVAAGYLLPDTGQTQCYDGQREISCPKPGEPYYGQDAQYIGPQPSYQDNGNGTVSDLGTGLVWQQGDGQNWDGQNETPRTWQDAVDYCGALDLGGNSDWRLPTKKELVSLVSYGIGYPKIDIQYFPGCRSSYYWSGSTYAYDPNYAWYVYFGHGRVDYYSKDGTFFVRCVRAGL